MEISEINEKYFKEEGYQALFTRLKTLVRMFNENKDWKQELNMLGFGILMIDDREECFGRIRELSDILHIPFKLNKVTNGEDVISYTIEL